MFKYFSRHVTDVKQTDELADCLFYNLEVVEYEEALKLLKEHRPNLASKIELEVQHLVNFINHVKDENCEDEVIEEAFFSLDDHSQAEMSFILLQFRSKLLEKIAERILGQYQE